MRLSQEKWPEVKRLYVEGFSAREIAEKFNLPLGSIYYFFRKNQIPRRNFKESAIALFNKKPCSFKIKDKLTVKEQILKSAGIMLYWAEGSNWLGECIVDFANSKPAMVKIFLKFLRIICGVDERRLRAYLYCFSNQQRESLMKFWSKETGIPVTQFSKPYVRKVFNHDRNSKMIYGLLHVRYCDKKLLLLIQQWIKEFAGKY